MSPTVKVTGEQEAPLYERLRWPVYDFEIAQKPRGFLRSLFVYSGGAWPTEGVFVPKGYRGDPEGEHWPKAKRWYRPMVEADEIFQEVTRIDVENRDALLEFLNRWGVLGVGARGAGPAGRGKVWLLDGVEDTRKHLRWLKERIELLHDLQQNPREKSAREDFAFDLSAALTEVHQAVIDTGEALPSFRLTFRVPRLWDALGVHLMELATDAGPLRRCGYCGSLFKPDRKDQKFCKTFGKQRCARRASLEAWRVKQKVLRAKAKSKVRRRESQ